MHQSPWNLGASTSWNPQSLSRPVMGLLYLYLVQYFKIGSVQEMQPFYLKYSFCHPLHTVTCYGRTPPPLPASYAPGRMADFCIVGDRSKFFNIRENVTGNSWRGATGSTQCAAPVFQSRYASSILRYEVAIAQYTMADAANDTSQYVNVSRDHSATANRSFSGVRRGSTRRLGPKAVSSDRGLFACSERPMYAPVHYRQLSAGIHW